MWTTAGEGQEFNGEEGEGQASNGEDGERQENCQQDK
jgi:hypothetical protein